MPRKPLFPKKPKPAAAQPASAASPDPAAPDKAPPTLRAMLTAAKAAGLKSVEAVIDHFFDIQGGQRAVAKMLSDEYDASKPGSLTRARILDLILRHMRALEERAGVTRDPAFVNESDLEREVTELGRRVLGQYKIEPVPAMDPAPAEAEAPDAPAP